MPNQIVPTEEQIKSASKVSFKSKAVLEKSVTAGCFYCTEIFPVGEVTKWTDNGETPLCPKCGIDSVLGDATGYPINKESLEMIRKDRF